MELKIYNPTDDGFIKAIEWNHEEIKKEISDKIEHYKNLVYTDDQIKEAKTDRATLRKFIDALDTKRKEIKKQCLQPYEEFEKEMKSIIAIVNEPVALIDKQVKEYEDKQKQEKKLAIEELFSTIGFQPFVTLELIWDEKWLNASVSMKKIEEQMKEQMYKIGNDILTLSNLSDFGFEATEIYKSTLDINRALNEAQRMSEIAKKKAENEAQMKARLAAEAEVKQQEEFIPPVADNTPFEEVKQNEQSKQWISFKALLSTEDALALRDFFKSRKIEFKAV